MIGVREYRMTDYFDVSRILEEAFGVTKANVNPDNNYKEYVAVVNDVVAGYLVLTRVLDLVKGRPYYLVDYVCVAKSYRNLGLGQLLMERVLEVARKDKALYIELTSRKDRVVAHHLYEKVGFEKRDSYIYRRTLQ
ncbi:MAG: GNAT family N-acetyltransferase [Bacilli bacterium]|nr:GNAT family N-acetyltransferase [Mycoplasmatota bacterium]MDD6264678.1 GNAT family N-acetyltransferase [bacterium]MDY2696794.1 GNAT family N-acetyltransferase [Bacilli bacterium]MDD6941488.1 GNAT family N-acetyltransferase [bacterium]MDY5992767.1 GNAT family N-acetyltransferase [Bacilli bacterium]